MGHDKADVGGESITFESIGIGPTGGAPVEYAVLDAHPEIGTDERHGRSRWVAVAVGVVALLAVVGWATVGRSSPPMPDSIRPEIPADPTKTFTWTADSSFTPGEPFVGGTADDVIVLANTDDGGVTVALNNDGSERWRASTESFEYATSAVRDDAVITVLHDTYYNEPAGTVTVTSLDAHTGQQNWQQKAPGTWSFLYDGHIIVLDQRSVGDPLPGGDPADLASIDLISGERTELLAVDSVAGVDLTTNGLMLVVDGEAYLADGNLQAASVAVPVGDGFAGPGDGQILVVDGGEMVLYDAEGAVIHSTTTPAYLQGAGPYRVSGAADVWYYTDFDSFASGAFRYGADGEPVELWQQERSLIYDVITFGDPSTADTGSTGVYASRFSFSLASESDESESDQNEFIDLTTGSVIRRTDSVMEGVNGIVADGDGHALGYLVPDIEGAPPTFGIPTTDTSSWMLIDGAVAVIDTPADGGLMSLTLYS